MDWTSERGLDEVTWTEPANVDYVDWLSERGLDAVHATEWREEVVEDAENIGRWREWVQGMERQRLTMADRG
ncbi:hypothetical protein BC936DRAFT_147416 [Jimgerdemannia flammicorona]|uniref:Uncharacterized protein n=1 Tax=Jimgerdemannia flammicorona TaxID=994334 RepID=A0A433D5H5_9FUNG|nr:hypothetical protein BC936DRAFT_147416 [Jimgerdemannia flammicorona]